MPPRRSRTTRRRLTLDAAASYDIELSIGPTAAVSMGQSPAEVEELLRESWQLRRGAVLARTPGGSRPWAWWRFEAGEERPGDPEAEAARLLDLDAMPADEIAGVIDAGRRLVADQRADRIAYMSTPHEVAVANVLCRRLRRAPIDEPPFHLHQDTTNHNRRRPPMGRVDEIREVARELGFRDPEDVLSRVPDDAPDRPAIKAALAKVAERSRTSSPVVAPTATRSPVLASRQRRRSSSTAPRRRSA